MSKEYKLEDGVLYELIFRKSRLVNGKKIFYRRPFPLWVPVEK